MGVFCVFSANYFPNLGGVERYTYNLAKKLLEKGHKIIIVTSNVFQLKELEENNGIKIYRMPCINLLNGRFPVIKPNKRFCVLLKLLLAENIDYVMVNTRFYIHSFLGVLIANKMKVPSIVIEHGTNHFTINNKILDALGRIYEHLITYWIKKNKPFFGGVSEACNLWLSHFGIKSQCVLYNAVDIDEITFLRSIPAKDYRKEYGLTLDDIIVTYSGRLVKEKGILNLIQAVQNCCINNSGVYLFIAGDGDLYSYVNDLKIKNVIVLGRIDFHHVISLLGQSDIFCLPTEYPEGLPTSILEAAACECYCITTIFGGSKELIINNQYGEILPDNKPSTIESALNRAIYDRGLRVQAAQRTYERLSAYFTWDRTVETVINLFRAEV
ncbi:MAG: glycosyltransferase family 4 protein [Synergistaceae bacterium]|jgi:glycosyltransferase involved in cell wall biosynthesis|nr:glycosyltransferase family 4 protein [Synergistaceae bacterium]